MGSLGRYLTRAVGGALVAVLASVLPDPAGAMLEPQKDPSPVTHRGDLFPLPPTLEPAVAFWTKVFAVWQRDQLVLHDSEHLGVVYRVTKVPGPVTESLTPAQRDWVRRQSEDLAESLRQLAVNKAAGRRLNAEEQALEKAIRNGGGSLRGAAERVRAQRGTRERFLRGLEISGRYDAAFRRIFREHGLPEDLAYLPHVESSFQIGARSSVGAAGMWQFMPATARSFMTVNATVDERLNPLAAATGAARYLAGAYRELGTWPLAVTSYNHGIGSMRRAQARFGNDFGRIVREYDAPAFGFASRNFYPEFLAVRRIARSPGEYFPEGIRYQAPLEVKPLVLQRPRHAHEISRESGALLAQLAELNPGWSSNALKGKSRLPAGVTVWLPAGSQPPDPTRFADSTGGRYTVAQGDSLWSIARRHGVSVASLSARNGIDPGKSHLRPGQVLDIPGRTGESAATKTATASASRPTTHRVTRGDTPFAIASAYRVRLRDLLAANNMNADSVIRPGQQLVIPGDRR